MRTLPSGTVTFLFTDIEGSTRLVREFGDRYAEVLATQRQLVRRAFSDHHGVEVDTQGDAFFVAFKRASDAVAAAYDAQRALIATPIRVRMGIHTGNPIVTAEGYVGLDVHRGARICAAGHGGQVLLSQATRALIERGVELRDLGEHRLKDLPEPEWLFQLLARGLESEFPPLRTLGNTNLPAQVGPLVGRERELSDLIPLLVNEDVRLLTLTGPGGTGKTRLAIHLAAQLIEHFRNGVFLVSLAPVSDPDLVLATVARTLGVTETSGETLFEGLRRHLQGRSLLLVLDNFEHLLPGAPEIARLLALESQLKIIVTSRERLRLSGEHERIITPLLPDDAVALFDARARAASGRFTLAAAYDAVVRICEQLDNLPLAIELAAARTKYLSADELLARLDRRLLALGGAPRDAHERQRTLRATIDWSYELLTQTEQRVFARLSVFAGGCTLDAAAVVCDADEDVLASLVDKSLLRSEDERYLMLETVREYAAERLAAHGDNATVRRRHADQFLDLAERAEPFLNGPEQISWLARLEREHDNFRAALAQLLERSESETVMRLCGALWRSWLVHGRFDEGRRWLDLALSKPGGGAARAQALIGAGTLALSQTDRARSYECFTEALALYRDMGNDLGIARSLVGIGGSIEGYAKALPYIEEALTLQRRLGDNDGMARSLDMLGGIAWTRGDLEAARSSYQSALDLQRRLGDLRGIAGSLGGVGDVARARSDFGAARSYYEEGLSIHRKLGDRPRIAMSLFVLGLVARNQGDHKGARSLQQEALAISRDLGLPRGIADSLGSLARLACDEGDYQRARSLLNEALGIVGEGAGRAIALSELGDVAHLEGKDDEGARLQRESLRLWRALDGSGMLPRCLERLALAITATGQAERACRLLGAAEAQREGTGAPRPLWQQPAIDRCVDSLRHTLGEDQLAAGWAEGRAMTRDRAVDYALIEASAGRADSEGHR